MSNSDNVEDECNHAFYCTACLANIESDCYCDRVIGIYPAAKEDIPIVNISDDERDKYFRPRSNKTSI